MDRGEQEVVIDALAVQLGGVEPEHGAERDRSPVRGSPTATTPRRRTSLTTDAGWGPGRRRCSPCTTSGDPTSSLRPMSDCYAPRNRRSASRSDPQRLSFPRAPSAGVRFDPTPSPCSGRTAPSTQTRGETHEAHIILTHGAYADSSSWNGVIDPLTADGHRVIAWANPCAASPPMPPPSATRVDAR